MADEGEREQLAQKHDDDKDIRHTVQRSEGTPESRQSQVQRLRKFFEQKTSSNQSSQTGTLTSPGKRRVGQQQSRPQPEKLQMLLSLHRGLGAEKQQPDKYQQAGITEQSSPQGMMTSPEQQRLGQGQLNSNTDGRSPGEQQGTVPLHAQRKLGQEHVGDQASSQTDRQQITHGREQNSLRGMVTSYDEQQRPEQEQVDDLDRPQLEKREVEGVREPICQYEKITLPEHECPEQEQVDKQDTPQPEKQQEMMSTHQQQRLGLEHVDDGGKPGKPVAGIIEQGSQRGMMTSSDQQRLRQEQVGDPDPAQLEKLQVEGVKKRSSSHETISLEQLRPIKLDNGVKSQPETQQVARAEEQSCQQEMMSSMEQQRPDWNRDTDQQGPQTELQTSGINQVEGVIQSAALRRVTHQSVVPAHNLSGSQQPASVAANIVGNYSPAFVGPSSGNTINYNLVLPASTGTQERFQVPRYVPQVSEKLRHAPLETSSQGVAAQPTEVASSQEAAQSIQEGASSSTRPSQGSDPAQAAADMCEKAIKTRYLTTGSYVQMIPWVDDDTKHIMDIYTQLRLENGGDKVGKVECYEDIFLIETLEGYLIKRAILCGWAGLGKSTLVSKIAYDWAIGLLKRFKLLFALRMHALEQHSQLIDAVFDQLLDQDTPIDKSALESFIKANPGKVLIVLDGFDELMTTNMDPNKFGSILKIMNRKEGRECFVVVTTRPSHSAKLTSKSLIEDPFTHVKVLGFSSDAVYEYVNKFYCKETDKAEELSERIKYSSVLFDLAKSPMLLLLMCLLWRETSKLPDTMSRLYDEAVIYIFNRKFEMSREEISEIVIQIGKVALRGLISDEVQLLSFKETDFEENVLNTALKVGILTSQRVLKGLKTHNSIQFIHKTFQEYCAARYLQSLVEAEAEQFQTILDSLYNQYIFEYLLRFVCGDNEVCTNKILQMLQKGLDEASNMEDVDEPSSIKRIKILFLICYYESQSKSLPPMNLTMSVITEEIPKLFMFAEVNALLYLLKKFNELTKGQEENAHLAKVERILMKGHNLHDIGELLACSLSGMTNLSVLELKYCKVTNSSIEHIVSSLGNPAALTEVDLSDNDNLCRSGDSWTNGLREMVQLRKLVLERCSLRGENVKCIIISIKELPNVAELSLKGNDLGGTSVTWSSHLQDLKQLQKLDLRYCQLKFEDIKHISFSISNMPALLEFGFSCNLFFADTSESWAPCLQQMKHLHKMYVSHCSVSRESLNPSDFEEPSVPLDSEITGSALYWLRDLPHMTGLRDLEVNSKFTVDDFKVLVVSLASMKHLVKCEVTDFSSRFKMEPTSTGIRLDLSWGSLFDTDLADVLEAMSSRSDLVEMVIRQLSSPFKSAAPWSSLQGLKSLKSLKFVNWRFTTQDVKYIVVSIAKMENLVSCNNDDRWSMVEQTMCGIKIDLSSQSFIDQDLADILKALSHRTDLVELILGRNETHGSSASLWSPHLKSMKGLKRLELAGFSLNTHDLKCLVVSIASMENAVNFCLRRSVYWFMSEGVTDIVKPIGDDSIVFFLSGSSLLGTDLKDILEAMVNRNDQVVLYLSRNESLGGLACLWSPSLKHLKRLRRLELRSCSLTSEDVQQIAASLSDATSLLELSLMGNTALGGKAESWAPCLQRMQYLRVLELECCRLTDHDIQCVLSSKAKMKDLDRCTVGSHSFFRTYLK